MENEVMHRVLTALDGEALAELAHELQSRLLYAMCEAQWDRAERVMSVQAHVASELADRLREFEGNTQSLS